MSARPPICAGGCSGCSGSPAEHSKRLNLRDRVREIAFTPTGSDFESQLLLYSLLRANFPKTYAARLRLRPAPLVKLHLENEYPRASVTTRLGKQDGQNLYYGPFPSRVAARSSAAMRWTSSKCAAALTIYIPTRHSPDASIPK